jgi:hypothetical protein
MPGIPENSLRSLAESIRDKILQPVFNLKTRIFLCGASQTSKLSKRDILARLLPSGFHFYKYELIYPEEIFEELISGPNSIDLLSLENMLAESVDAIVIVPESPGAIAELGAFANNESLRNKMVCVQDVNYRRKKSFINYGPIKLIRKSDFGSVVYVDFNDPERHIVKVRNAIAKVFQATNKKPNVADLLQSENFIIPCIYLLEPVSREIMESMVRYASDATEPIAKSVTSAALTILGKKNFVSISPDGYSLTSVGLKQFFKLRKTGKSSFSFNMKIMDKLRSDVLTWKYRRKKLILS